MELKPQQPMPSAQELVARAHLAELNYWRVALEVAHDLDGETEAKITGLALAHMLLTTPGMLRQFAGLE